MIGKIPTNASAIRMEFPGSETACPSAASSDAPLRRYSMFFHDTHQKILNTKIFWILYVI